MTIAAITTARPGRVSVISAIASRIDGMAMIPSMIRITIASKVRLKPQTSPRNSPMSDAAAATLRPTTSEIRVP